MADKVIIQDQAEWDKWTGVLVLTEEHLRFERPGLLPGRFIVCFDLPIVEISATVGGSLRKQLICVHNSRTYAIKLKNPHEWVKMLKVLGGR